MSCANPYARGELAMPFGEEPIDWSPIELTLDELAQIRDSGQVRPSGDPWWREASKPVFNFIRAHPRGVTLRDLRRWIGVQEPSARGSRRLPWRLVEECVYWLDLREKISIENAGGEIRLFAR